MIRLRLTLATLVGIAVAATGTLTRALAWPANPVDRCDEVGQPDRFDVCYGMADRRIGVARLDLPDILPDDPAHERCRTV